MGDNITFGLGQGVITSADGSETANYTFIGIGNVTEEGRPVFYGASDYSTDSTGKLSFLNNILGIFNVEIDQTGKFSPMNGSGNKELYPFLILNP